MRRNNAWVAMSFNRDCDGRPEAHGRLMREDALGWVRKAME